VAIPCISFQEKKEREKAHDEELLTLTGKDDRPQVYLDDACKKTN
jgi:hypothetical protein